MISLLYSSLKLGKYVKQAGVAGGSNISFHLHDVIVAWSLLISTFWLVILDRLHLRAVIESAAKANVSEPFRV